MAIPKNIVSTGEFVGKSGNLTLEEAINRKIPLIGAKENLIINEMGKINTGNPITYSYVSKTKAKPAENKQMEVTGLTPKPQINYTSRHNCLQIVKTDIMVSKSAQHATRIDKAKTLAEEIKIKKLEHDSDIELNNVWNIFADADIKKAVFKDPVPSANNQVAGECAGLFYHLANGATAFVKGRRGNVFAFDDAHNWTGKPTKITKEHITAMTKALRMEGGIKAKVIMVGANLKEGLNEVLTRIGKTEDVYYVDDVKYYGNSFSNKMEIRLYDYLSDEYGLGDVILIGDLSYFKYISYIATSLEKVTTDKTAIASRLYTQMTTALLNPKSLALGVGLSGK